MPLQPAVCVLGSITLDIVLNVDRFPVPGETLFTAGRGLFPGGKGLNQAVAASRLGTPAVLLGRVADDPFAAILLGFAEKEGVDCSGVVRAATGQTGLAVPVVVPGGENAILASPAANLDMTADDLDLSGRIALASIFMTQFETPLDVVEEALRRARAAGVPTLLNPAPVRPFQEGLFRLVDVLVVNEVEAAMLAPGLPDHASRARALLDAGPRAVVVTLGPAGGLLATPGAAASFDAIPVDAVDTVGAGDCFCAALAARLAEGAALPAAVQFAAAAAALSVTRPGAAPSYPVRAEVEALLARA